jgi:hypothetical protein
LIVSNDPGFLVQSLLSQHPRDLTAFFELTQFQSHHRFLVTSLPARKFLLHFQFVHIEHPSAQGSKKEENVPNKFGASIVAWFKVFLHNALLQ